MAHLDRRRMLMASSGLLILATAEGVTATPQGVANQTEGTKGKEKFKAKVNELQIDAAASKSISKASTPYDIKVINKSEWKITHTKVNNGPFYQVIPPVLRTAAASKTCKQAQDAGEYATVTSTTCESAAFTLILRVEKGNRVAETNPLNINPDCDYSGEIMCFNLDGN